MTSSVRKLAVHAAALFVAAAVLTFDLPAFAADDVPPDVRQGINSALRKRVSDLLSEKDKDGIAFKRGNYSEIFTPGPDGTWLVSFNQDTIEKAPDGKTDQMKVERFRLTLKKEGADYKIVDQKLEDSWAGIYHQWIGGGEFYRFDALSFEKEGLKVSATNGYMYTVNANGKIWGFRVSADDLAYTYAPPAGTDPWFPTKHDVVQKKRGEDLNFKPERLAIDCDSHTCAELLKTAFRGVAKLESGSGAATGNAGSRFSKFYDENVRDSEKQRKENPFSGFFLPVREDRRTWTFRFKRESSKEHWFLVDWDNYSPWEVTVWATGYWAPLYRYYDETTRNAGIAAYELEKREDIESRDYEVKSVQGSVDLAIESPDTLEGDIAYKLLAKKELTELPIFIPRNRNVSDDESDAKRPTLFMNSIRDDSGQELTWVRLNAFQALLILPKPVPAGSTIGLDLKFKSTGSLRQLNPSYTELNRGGWLPLVRFADFIDTFELKVRTPAKYQHLGIGKKMAERLDGDLRVTEWKSSSPVSFPTIIFGDYITDKSSHKATKIDGTHIPVNVWVDKVSTQALAAEKRPSSQADVDEFVQKIGEGARDIRGKQLGAIAVQAAVALDKYKQVYGIDYPFDKLDLVADPQGSFYGQAPASIIYLGFGVFRGEGEVAAGNLFAGGANIAKFNKDVVAHEVGHQWWGSLICNANDRNYWFVESLAELSSALYVEDVFGKKKYDEKVAEWRRNILEADPWSTVQNSYQIWSGEQGSPQAAIYNKGPYAFHVLRSTFGDEKFFKFLKELAQGLKGKQIVTRDIQGVMEQVYGGNMDWFFDQWIRGVGMPQYAVFYTIRQTEDGKWLVQGKIKQRVVAGVEKAELPGVYFRAVAPLTFVGPDGKKFKSSGKVLVQGPETPFQMKLAQEPTEVLFNDDGEILAQDVLYNRNW